MINPATGEVARAGPPVGRGRSRRRRSAPRARRCRSGARYRRSRAPQAVRAARAARRPRRGARAVGHGEMGKTIADAQAEVGAHDRDGRGGHGGPDHDAGTDPRGRLAATSTPRPSASRSACARRSSRSTSRPWFPFWFLPFAIACGNTFVLKPSEQVPADAADRLRGARRARAARRESSTSSTAAARSSRRSSTIPASTPSPSSARPRSRAWSTSAPRRPASACRRSAAPRTTWWSCPTR